MANWLFWLQFAAKILQLLQEIFGDDGRIVLKVEDMIVAKLSNQFEAPANPTPAELAEDPPKKA